MNYINEFLEASKTIIDQIPRADIEKMIDLLSEIRSKNGRVFFLGVGGSAANASHAVNDFRKICGMEAYTPVDNVSEFSARVNDDGWENVFVNWLIQSRLKENDAIFVLSVGGGNLEKGISPNLVKAIDYAESRKAFVLGIVGRDGGYTAKKADSFVIIPTVKTEMITPHAEAFQSVIWHLLVSHPRMKAFEMKWESVNNQ